MAHIGVFCPVATGHLNPLITLTCELRRRGHRVTFFQIADAAAKVRAAGLDFHTLGAKDYPLGHMAAFLAELGRARGPTGLRLTLRWGTEQALLLHREGPDALRAAGVDLVLVDQTAPGGETVAERCGLPYVSVACALAINQEIGVPPGFTAWRYAPGGWARLRNAFGYGLVRLATTRLRRLVQDQRRAWGLPSYPGFNDRFSPLAQLSQQPAEFEFPRRDLPPWFHFCGPFHDPADREPVAFPYERLDGRPLVYASMGTIQNRVRPIFARMAEACAGLDVQLVIALGGGTAADEFADLPGSPVVVGYAPQLDLLKRATLTITHAGLNTVLESLAVGVPMVAVPITNDQPGVAARLDWCGAGLFVSPRRLTVRRLRAALEHVLTEPSFRTRAERLQAAILRTGGARYGADVVERVLATGRPVPRADRERQPSPSSVGTLSRSNSIS